MTIADAESAVPRRPGLYAVFAEPDTWAELGLGTPPDGRPLYVGKAERSLASRDVRTHFASGKTGSSTLRRTLAGLLATALDLHAVPRNLAKPGYFSNFGLTPDGDARLTAWMVANLRLSVWVPDSPVTLDDVETEVLNRVEPPLNLSKIKTPWSSQVSAGRAELAAEARRWRRTDTEAVEAGRG